MTRVSAFINRPHRAMGWVLLPLWALVVWQFVEALIQRNWFWVVVGGFASVMILFSLLWNLGVMGDPTATKQRCDQTASR